MIAETLSVNPKPTAIRTVVVPPREGLHLRMAASIIHLARQFHSTVYLVAGQMRADARSILQLLELGAAGGQPVVIAAEGPDAQEAVRALAAAFTGPHSNT